MNTDKSPVKVALGLGSNMGTPLDNLKAAIKLLSTSDGIQVIKRSSCYQTPPWGPVPQDPYINICLVVETTLTASTLLERCLDIEKELGRVRDIRWGPRLIDIDILLYGTDIITLENLTIPHPRMTERAFVLVPLAEIWPDALLPTGESVSQVLAKCPDTETIVKLESE